MSGRSKNRRRTGPAPEAAAGGQDAPFRMQGGRVVDADGRPVQVVRTGEQIDLGDLAPEDDNPEVTATFTLKGQRFRVAPDLSELTIADLLEEGQRVDIKDPRVMTFVKTYALAHVHPDDHEVFWARVRELRWDSTQIMVLCWQILEGITENPTGERSDSSDGPLETSQSSAPGASRQDVGPGFPDRPGDRELIREGMPRQRSLRDAYQRQIDRIQGRTDEETGQLLPINAAVAAQLVVAARSRGIDLESPSVAATG